MSTQTAIFESAGDLSAENRTNLRNLLIAIADTKLLLGYHYGEWTFGPPQIEAAIACCSLCQSELGHVRLLHGLLNKHCDEDPDRLVCDRAPEEFANIPFLDSGIANWAGLVAANYVVDFAVTTLLYSLKDSAFQPLHMSLEKMLQEERYHVHHGKGWFRTLALKNEDTRTALGVACARALQDVAEWFGPPEESAERQLLEAGVKQEGSSSALARVFAEIGNSADELQVEVGLHKSNDEWALVEETAWQDWDSRSRRVRQSQPDQDILYHLRGNKNEVFKLS